MNWIGQLPGRSGSSVAGKAPFTEVFDIMGFHSNDDDDDIQNDEPQAPAIGLFNIRHLTEAQLAGLGVSHLAYVKPVLVNGTRAFAIHGADGTPMAVAGAEDLAMAAIRQHEMVPALVH
jgi:hypothetical protein